jgi:hypothetical protein
MEKKSYRTSMPEILYPGTGLSNLTDKSVMPFNNVHTIWDVLTGDQYKIPGAGGDWGDWSRNDEAKPGSYKEDGDLYKRRERDLDILFNLNKGPNIKKEVWKVKCKGGSKEFPSLELAQKYKKKIEEKGFPVQWITRIAQASEDKNKIIDSSLEKTFTVTSKDYSTNIQENGTCFCIGQNLFLTCAHVIMKYDKNTNANIQPEGNIEIYLNKEDKISKAELIDFDGVNDLALLRSNVNCDKFSFDISATIGKDIFTVGSPHGFQDNVNFGNISSTNRLIFSHNGAPEYMFVDMSILPGNSGGPVINMNDGKVLGIITAIVSQIGGDKNVGLSAALDSSYIIGFLNKNNIRINF